MITLIVGGARSGKSSLASRLAQKWVSNQGRGQLHHVATAIPFDEEMTLRIKHHQRSRGDVDGQGGRMGGVRVVLKRKWAVETCEMLLPRAVVLCWCCSIN